MTRIWFFSLSFFSISLLFQIFEAKTLRNFLLNSSGNVWFYVLNLFGVLASFPKGLGWLNLITGRPSLSSFFKHLPPFLYHCYLSFVLLMPTWLVFVFVSISLGTLMSHAKDSSHIYLSNRSVKEPLFSIGYTLNIAYVVLMFCYSLWVKSITRCVAGLEKQNKYCSSNRSIFI